MGLSFATVPGELPLVQRVWSARCDDTIDFASTAKSCSMIAFVRRRDQMTVHVRGPETRATRQSCPGDTEYFGVDLRPGAHLPLFAPATVANLNDALLPITSGKRIVLGNLEWEMPNEHNVDVFINHLVQEQLLAFDPVVDEICHGNRPSGMSERTAQLRFRRAVGISHRKAASIQRARRAAQLLTGGATISDAVSAGGYYDQPQLTHAMRWATGHTPRELGSPTVFLAF